ncbi:MAG: response regulator transcription factor [Deferribacterota bacterium]|nr:response regulator transcription factor [Deferribacterota bacterium]
MDKINILIADDHDLVREGLVAILNTCNDFKVVAQVSDGVEAIEMFKKYRPDIVLMDIRMPKLGGYEATLEIKKIDKDAKIIVLTQYDDTQYILRFLQAGVSGYILKKAAGVELISAIKAVSRGEVYLYPDVASEIVAGYLGKKDISNIKDPYDKLTDREKQVLKLLAEGYTHKEIAEMLNISIKTTIAHQSNISEKLDLHSKYELIKFAIRRGIIKINE